MFSISMHTEILVCFTTQIGQPLDTNVLHVLLERKMSLIQLCILLVTDMYKSLILEC
jgi:hypothetical protein